MGWHRQRRVLWLAVGLGLSTGANAKYRAHKKAMDDDDDH